MKKKNCMKMINHTKNAKRGFKGRQCHVQKFKRKCRRWRQLGCDEDSMGGLGMALSRQAHGLRGCFGWAGGPATRPACSTFATISRASRFARVLAFAPCIHGAPFRSLDNGLPLDKRSKESNDEINAGGRSSEKATQKQPPRNPTANWFVAKKNVAWV